MPDFNPTVMPKEDPKPIDHLGAPGLQKVDNPEAVRAFSEVRNVDPKQLNAELQSKDAQKAASTPGIQIPQNANDIKEFSEVSKEDAAALNAKLQK